MRKYNISKLINKKAGIQVNDVRYEIYTDIVLRDNKGELLINEEIPNGFRRYKSESKCKYIVDTLVKNKNRIGLLIPYRIYLRYSIQRYIVNVTDYELEARSNKTVYERYVELTNLDKVIQGVY